MWELKSARDFININTRVQGSFILVGIAPQTDIIKKITMDRTRAFYCANTHTFKLLGHDFLEWYKEKLYQHNPNQRFPNSTDFSNGFSILGNRPGKLSEILHSSKYQEYNKISDVDKYFIELCSADYF